MHLWNVQIVRVNIEQITQSAQRYEAPAKKLVTMFVELWRHCCHFYRLYLLIMFGNQEVPNKLQVLQLNANKSSNVLLSLLNNSTLSHYDFLLLTEPWADCHPNNNPL